MSSTVHPLHTLTAFAINVGMSLALEKALVEDGGLLVVGDTLEGVALRAHQRACTCILR